MCYWPFYHISRASTSLTIHTSDLNTEKQTTAHTMNHKIVSNQRYHTNKTLWNFWTNDWLYVVKARMLTRQSNSSKESSMHGRIQTTTKGTTRSLEWREAPPLPPIVGRMGDALPSDSSYSYNHTQRDNAGIRRHQSYPKSLDRII